MKTIVKSAFILCYLLSCPIFGNSCVPSNLKFHGTQETLTKISAILYKREKGAYLRFGDGDINVASGVMVFDCFNYQVSSILAKKITFEMQEAFALNGDTILKTLPLYCPEFGGFENGMNSIKHAGSYSWCLNIYNRAKPFWGGPMADIYSHVALLFAATDLPEVCMDFLKMLKFSPDHIILIGNKNIPKDMRDLLFGSQCIFIPTPSTGSFFALDSLEAACVKKASQCSGYKVIITSTGCAGRILQKRLWNKIDNVFFFDFGSLMDGLCGEIDGLYRANGFEKDYQFDRKKFTEQLKLYLTQPKNKGSL